MKLSSTINDNAFDAFQNIDENINHVTCKTINCQMSFEQDKLYDEISKSKESQSKLISSIDKLYEHPFLIQHNSDELSQNSFMISGKMIFLKKLLESPEMINKKRIIIISKIELVLNIIKNYFNEKNYICLFLNPTIRGKERQEIIDLFNSKNSEIYILLIKSHSFNGINLSSTDTIIFYDNEINENEEANMIQSFNIKNIVNVDLYHLILKIDQQIDDYEINLSTFKQNKEEIDTDSKLNNQGINSISSKPYLEEVINSDLNLSFNSSHIQTLNNLPSFPLIISDDLQILTIGTLVSRSSFITSNYIYPLGYCAKRLEVSVKNQNEKVWYLLKIIEDDNFKPLFKIQMEDDESVFFEDSMPTKVYLKFLQNLKDKKNINLTGPQFYGLSIPIVRQIIQYLVGVSKLKNNSPPIKTNLKFQAGGACIPDQHYMVNLDNRVKLIKEEYVDKKEYFVINSSRQTGKTTTLFALAEYLKLDYYVFYVDLEDFDKSSFENNEDFVNRFLYYFLKSYDAFNIDPDQELIEPLRKLSKNKEKLNFLSFLDIIETICKTSQKKLVLLIDEIDKFKIKPQLLITFLSFLRGRYQKCHINPSFHSVILSGVRDIYHLRSLIKSDYESNESNSPWNINKAFTVEMYFTKSEIASMLEQYESFNHTGMEIQNISNYIYDYTSGHPYLVTMICKTIDEEISKDKTIPDKKDIWSEISVKKSVNFILNNKFTLLNDIILKVNENPDLKKMLYAIIVQNKTILYHDKYEFPIDIGIMFGLVKIINQNVVIVNRITQMLLTYRFISEEKPKDDISYDRSKYYKSGKLNMESILNRFIDHYEKYYNKKSQNYIESNGRFLFMTYLRPIINGIGHFYIESQIKDTKRTDLIVDCLDAKYLIEFIIFYGQDYIDKGINQIVEYLDINKLDTGYLIIFNFKKSKKVGIKKIIKGNKTIIQATV